MKKIDIKKDSLYTVIIKMSDGNPGAATAITQLLLEGDQIDVDKTFRGTGVLFLLNKMGIYGTDLYVLYNDICDRDMPAFMAVVIATASGDLDINTVKDASSKQDYSGKNLVDAETCYYRFRGKFPRFDLNERSKYAKV